VIRESFERFYPERRKQAREAGDRSDGRSIAEDAFVDWGVATSFFKKGIRSRTVKQIELVPENAESCLRATGVGTNRIWRSLVIAL